MRTFARLNCVLTIVSCISIFGVSAMFTRSGTPQGSGDWLTLFLVVGTAVFMAVALVKSDGTVRVLTIFALLGALAILVAWFLMFLKPVEKYGVPIGAVFLWLLGVVVMAAFSVMAWLASERADRSRMATGV